ncbi:helix-turn-helix domain-containing protein [Thalassotalea aquiviva]|uniref:helix-turn-helix domain-containing protein n=1 Tax=Thalassotalea aquiviva TaxID=3242415 RepID=UPI00352A7072
MNDFAKKLGLTIKLERTRRSMSQEELSDLTGMTQSHLSKIEIGKVNITVIKLMLIAEAFNLSISELLELVDS